MFFDLTWQTIDRVGIIIGIIVSVPVFYSAIMIFLDRQQRRHHLKEVRRSPGHRPTVLIIDVARPHAAAIRTQVENWLRSQEEFKDIPPKKIFVVRLEKEMVSKDMDKLIKDIQKKIGELMATGTDKVHLFMKGPLAVAACVGEILSNSGCPIILYQNQPNHTYENWGPLRH
jgi:MFS superfamily sulfate permease-like transporter